MDNNTMEDSLVYMLRMEQLQKKYGTEGASDAYRKYYERPDDKTKPPLGADKYASNYNKEDKDIECSSCNQRIAKDGWYLVCEKCGKIRCCNYYVFNPGYYQSIRFCSRCCWEDGH